MNFDDFDNGMENYEIGNTDRDECVEHVIPQEFDLGGEG